MFIDHRYEVIESLGSGTWANVYKVRDIRSSKYYTLKLFQYISSQDLFARFSAEEMHHITKIEHPNLNHVVDFGHVGDHIYFISEFFDGATLNGFRFAKNKLNQIYELVVQTCYALHALHTQNILHKDLKLENILYKYNNKNLEIKLIDYGFSKIDPERDSQLVSGTLPYIAPEVYLGKHATASSDFYSLGVILYRLCTGSFPFNLDQINALLSGSQQYFIPIFPSELNKDIPLTLEKLILRLLEKNPESRFQSSEEIISYVNRISGSDYPFSASWSLVNTLRFNSYIVREHYSHQLLDYLPAVQKHNGKTISLIGGDGLGKDNILSLFRYHILGGEYFIFDYSCSRTEHEAFFALIKEYLQSLPEKEVSAIECLKSISPKFRSYLFSNDYRAKEFTQTQEELHTDFTAVRTLLVDMSEHKPIIFIIRNFQYVHRYTVDFINFMSPYMVNSRIMVVLSCNEFNKVNLIEHTIMLNIPMLTMDESRAYACRLMGGNIPESFNRSVYMRSAGNPHFIREILVDLTQRKRIYFDKQLHFPEDLSDYHLPSRVQHSIYSRMSHITEINYAHLQKLSVVQTPLSRELILYILKIKDHELYSLLNESVYNEIMEKQGKYYYYTFAEAKQRFFDECSDKVHISIATRVLKYYKNKLVSDVETCRGLISNAALAGDKLSERLYWLRLYQILSDEFEQHQAYEAILNVLKIDFEDEVEISAADVIRDLNSFHEKTEATGYFKGAGFVTENADKIPEIFEKHLVLGTLNLLAESGRVALQHFQRASELAVTGRQRVLSYLYLARINAMVDINKAKTYLSKINPDDLNLELRIAYVDRLAVFYSIEKDFERAIKTIEDFLETLPPEHDTSVMIRLAAMHNDLGVFYSDQKNIPEAGEHLNIALSIWKRYNIRRYLGLIYNNISDLYLKQGFTMPALEYSQQGFRYAAELNLTLTQALALLNQGEAKIKMGEFQDAEEKLKEARELILSVGSKNHLDSIQRNLALAKSKIKGFGHYYQFISEVEPQLMNGSITEINPLVKTYFYYLNEIANPKKLRRLIRKNVQINYKHIHEEEFLHNVLSLMALSDKDYDTALNELKQAMHYAGEINNNYALAVFNILQINCYYGLQNYTKARELLESSRSLIEQNKYRYWQHKLDILDIKLDLTNPEVPLRKLLRSVNSVLDSCRKYEYYQLVVELWQMKIQVLLEMAAESQAQDEFEQYQSYLEQITADIAEDDRTSFLNANLYHVKVMKKFDAVVISSRRKDTRVKWNELLYNIANVNSIDRIKFLIEKGLGQVISPWQFKLMMYSERISNYFCFQCFNCESETIVPPEFSPYVAKAFESDTIVIFSYNKMNVMTVPLISGSDRIGYLLVSDISGLDFTRNELTIMRNIKGHLTALMIRINNYTQITRRIEKMNALMHISHELMSIVDMADLEREIVSSALDFTNATRGFLIKRDNEGNNLYQVQMDRNKQLLSTTAGISKTALSMSQNTQEPILTFNAQEDKSFKNSISVQDYAIHTIYCSPITVDQNIFGYLYLDNLGESSREMYLNEDIMALFQKQIGISIKNALQYEAILRKSHELNEFEELKDEFMSIVSHELNTPLTTLQGYVSRLKRRLYSDDDERQEIVNKVETSVKKLILSIGDISTMNYYNLAKSLVKASLDIDEILELVHQEVEILSRSRKMFIKMEVEKNLPQIHGNWEGIHRMVHNIVLNAIRFTNDFGSIVIGARRSVFPTEKINNRESLVIFVQDNGIGIPAFQLKNIFRKFYELNEIYAHKSGTIEYRSSGLGLGLATARKIAQLHGGEISIKSKENEGTTVFIILPFKK